MSREERGEGRRSGQRAVRHAERRAVDAAAERRTFKAEPKCAAEGD